jgi:flagellar basal body-associated protein FliL
VFNVTNCALKLQIKNININYKITTFILAAMLLTIFALKWKDIFWHNSYKGDHEFRESRSHKENSELHQKYNNGANFYHEKDEITTNLTETK